MPIPDAYRRQRGRPASLDGPTAERSGGPAGYGAGASWSGGPLYADAFGAKRGPSPAQLVESYSQIAFACTEFNSLGVAALPIRLYAASGHGMPKPRTPNKPRSVRRTEADRLTQLPYVRRQFSSKDVEDVHEITNHLLLDALENPAVDPERGLSYFDRPTFVATLVRYLDVVGMAYLKPEDAAGTGLADLVAAKVPPPLWWPLQSQYVWPIRVPGSALIDRFKYFTQEYAPADIVMIRLRPSLRDPYGSGYAAAQAAWQYSGLEAKGISMWDQLLGAGARPNVVFSPKDPEAPWGEDERRRFSAELSTFQAGGRGGRHLVLAEAVDVNVLNYPGFDTGEMQVNVYNLERMCNCWGVPVSFMTRETNLANFQAGRTFHAQFGIEPRAQCIASALTGLARRYDPRLFFAFDGAIGEDKLQNAQIIDMKVKAGIITGNEANSDEPWAPKPWLEEPWIPGTLVQPSMAVEKHEQGLESAKAADKAKANDPASDGQPQPGGGRSGGDRFGASGEAHHRAGAPNLSDAERALTARAAALIERMERDYDR